MGINISESLAEIRQRHKDRVEKVARFDAGDEGVWVTIHDARVLLSEAGDVLGGAGGALDGMKFEKAAKKAVKAKEAKEKKAEADKKKAKAEKSKTDKAKKAEETKRKAEEAKRKAEEEKRKEEEARKKAEEEKRKAEEEERRKAEEEEKRKLEEESSKKEEDETKMDTSLTTLEHLKECQDEFKEGSWFGKIDEKTMADAQEGMKKVLDGADMCSNINPKNLDSILKTGFKNQFETGTSDGSHCLSSRASLAHVIFGVKDGVKGVPAEEREKYGYLTDKNDETQMFRSGIWYGNDSWDSSVLGKSCSIVFRDEMKDKATWTSSDSLSAAHSSRSSYAAGSVDTKPTLEGLSYSGKMRGTDTVGKLATGKISSISDLRKSTGGCYTEAQYHGTIKANSFDRITFRSREQARATINRLSSEGRKIMHENGIKVAYFTGGKYHEMTLAEFNKRKTS